MTRRSSVGLALDELERATRKFGTMNSAHEGYAIILEEMDELWEAIKFGNMEEVEEEAIQVAAMSLRFLMDVCEND